MSQILCIHILTILRKVREKLKEMGYKSGRISQLVGATRPSSSSGLKRPAAVPEKDGGGQPATDSEESVAENPSSSSGLKRPAAAVEQEVEEESDAYNGLQVAAINALQLPRLRGKQTPKGKWTRMRVPAWVQERLAEDSVVGEQDAPMAKPATRKIRPKERCAGSPPDKCIFSTSTPQDRAQVHPSRPGGQQCMFCSLENFKAAVVNPRGKGAITSDLAFFEENSQETFDKACERIRSFSGEEALEQCLQRLARLRKSGMTKEMRGRNAREKKKEREEAQRCNTWTHWLQNRVSQTRVTEAEKKKYKDNTKRNAWRRISKKFPGVYRPDGGPARPNVEWRTPLAAAFKEYAEQFSWAMCAVCCRLVPQKFHPKHMRASGRGRSLQVTILQQEGGLQGAKNGRHPEAAEKLVAKCLGSLGHFPGVHGPL